MEKEIKKLEKKQLLERFGEIPTESEFKTRERIHQGWWRMNVLNEKPGLHPKDKKKNVCNTIFEGITNKKNFLTENAIKAVDNTVLLRNENDGGIMEKDRLYNNLLSSQPLCFNFFGELMENSEFGLKILQNWWKNITELKKVTFEYSPKERYTKDNSAFDIAFEVAVGDKIGLIGLECKYTDTFSSKEYDKPEYENIFNKSTSFSANYNELKDKRFNQLFRNQLIAEALIQNKKYDFVKTGLFCHQQDNSTIQTGNVLKEKLVDSDSFTIITYENFIESVQQLNLNWKQREWTMLLWARYCGTILSDSVFEELK